MSDWTYYTPAGDSSLQGNSIRRMVRNCWQARDLAWRMFCRDMGAKYRQSLLGYFWAVVPALAMTMSFVLAGQATILNTSGTSIPYPLFALVGTVLWQTFADAVHAPLTAITTAKPLLSRIRFPYDAIILAKLGEVLFTLGIRLVLVAVALPLFGVFPSWGVLFAPAALLTLVMLGTGLGLMLSTFSSLYKDVEMTLSILLNLWFFLTPIMYEQAADGSIISVVNAVNPITPVLVAARQALTGQPLSISWGVPLLMLVAGVMTVYGWATFRRSINRIVERIG